MTKPWRNITTIWSDKKNCVFVFISVNLTGDSTIVADIYFLANGLLQLSFGDIAMPIIGLLALISLWEGGRQSKLSKQKREMQKMKAQDSKHHD